ncbi:MAG: WGR domain-containing protein [Chloroflexi bacterium]|nr:WGR domain-containing protein [Chloroflexota bacterium]
MAKLLQRDTTKDRCRFYTIAWQRALWGGGAMIRCWGRIGTEGRSMPSFYPDRESAQAMV